jgi:hypothetical protein
VALTAAMWLIALVSGVAHARYLFVPGSLPPSTVISSNGISTSYLSPSYLPYLAYPEHQRQAMIAAQEAEIFASKQAREPDSSAGNGVAIFAVAALVAIAGSHVSRARPIVASADEEATRDPPSSSYADYMASRSEVEKAQTDATYRSFKGIDQEFDGGDSGGGVVGDGNTDLEDQHNSATLGALRGGIADVTGATLAAGRGNVVQSATDSRVASAGKNYFGRSTGLAQKYIDSMTEEDVKAGKMDCVRAQQKENWFNQRAIHEQNRKMGQGVVYGEEEGIRPRSGGFNTREAISSDAARRGAQATEISQADLNKHLNDLAAAPAERLDGEAWSDLIWTSADTVTETFELRAAARSTEVVTIPVKNDLNTFAPFRCELVYPSHPTFTVSPNHGTMNRRSGEPTEVVVRYTPDAPGVTTEATVVFETEDMKKVYRFIGTT